MKNTLRNTILAAAVIGVGSFFLTGCNTVEGTMHGASRDVNAVENTMNNDHETRHHHAKKGHHVNKKKHGTAHHKSMQKHTAKSGVDSEDHNSMSSNHPTNENPS